MASTAASFSITCAMQFILLFEIIIKKKFTRTLGFFLERSFAVFYYLPLFFFWQIHPNLQNEELNIHFHDPVTGFFVNFPTMSFFSGG